MSIRQLVYISAATVPFDDDDLRDLLNKARANNDQQNISGMLVYHDGAFIQVLEGEGHAVDTLYEKIDLDKRHVNTTVLLRNDVSERTFEAWSMGYLPSKSLSDIPDGFHAFLKSGFKHSHDTDNAVRSALLAFKEGRWRAKL